MEKLKEIINSINIPSKYKNVVMVVVAITIFLLVTIMTNIFNTSNIILSKYQINKVISQAENKTRIDDTGCLNIDSIEGNKKYILFTIKNSKYNGEQYAYYMLYDTGNDQIITSITDKTGTLIDIFDASVVKYIGNNMFAIVNSQGDIYRYNASSDKVEFINSIDVKKSTIFKSIYNGEYLYIIKRDNLDNYNNNVSLNNVLYSINILETKTSKITIDTYVFNPTDYIYSFVFDDKGDISILGSSTVAIDNSIVKTYALTTDSDFLSKLSLVDNLIRFTDCSNIWVMHINTKEKTNISEYTVRQPESLFNGYELKIISDDIGRAVNVPILYSSKAKVFVASTYDSILANVPNNKSSILTLYKDESLSSLEMMAYGDVLFQNSRKYICFIKTTNGLAGIDAKGNAKLVSKNKIAYFDGKHSIELQDNTIIYK